MKTKPSILILHEDPQVVSVLKEGLARTMPDRQVAARYFPHAAGSFDAYVIGDSFFGQRFAANLVADIRRRSPNAPVVVAEAEIEPDDYRRLLNAGCAGVVAPKDRDDMNHGLSRLKLLMETQATGPNDTSVRGTVRSIRRLLSDWNQILNRQEATR
jgi:hypothetical protein